MKINILNIKDPRKLFKTGSSEEYHKLLFSYHPDHGGTDDEFKKLTSLYEEAQRIIELGLWNEEPNTVIFKTTKNSIKIRYLKIQEFELGTMYICSSNIIFFVKKEFDYLSDNAAYILRSLKYPSDENRKLFNSIIPFHEKVEVESGDLFIFKREPTALLLNDVLKYFKNVMHPKTVAWILSRLYNIACFNYYNEVAHNDISLNTVFISMENHNVYMIGGWWYARKIGSALLALPQRTMTITKYTGNLTIFNDIKLINNLGLSLLGNKFRKDVPKFLTDWLLLPNDKSPYDIKEMWGDVIINSFKERKFFKEECNINYGE